MKTRLLTCFALTLLAAACDNKAGNNVELKLSGDSLVPAKFINDAKGFAMSAECKSVFAANLNADEGTKAKIVSGRITYKHANGTTVADVKWDEKKIREIWPDNELEAGRGTASMPFGVSTSLPFQQLRGTAVFDYAVEGADAARTTTPITFVCQ